VYESFVRIYQYKPLGCLKTRGVLQNCRTLVRKVSYLVEISALYSTVNIYFHTLGKMGFWPTVEEWYELAGIFKESARALL
jgi:hypothetical protein